MRGRLELAFFALALVCVAAIVLPFARCGRDSSAGKPGAGGPIAAAREVRNDPRSVGEEMVRRYVTFDGDHEAWQQRVLELATDPLRSRVASWPPEINRDLLTYGVKVTPLSVEFLGLKREGEGAELLVKVSARGVPSKPGGEWSLPRETTRKLRVYLVKEGERWLVSEMAYEE